METLVLIIIGLVLGHISDQLRWIYDELKKWEVTPTPITNKDNLK